MNSHTPPQLPEPFDYVDHECGVDGDGASIYQEVPVFSPDQMQARYLEGFNSAIRMGAVPDGFVLIKKSRLDTIKELAVDPSEPCYMGDGEYDNQQLLSNWCMCTGRLSDIYFELMAATDWEHDADDLEEGVMSATIPAAQSALDIEENTTFQYVGGELSNSVVPKGDQT